MFLLSKEENHCPIVVLKYFCLKLKRFRPTEYSKVNMFIVLIKNYKIKLHYYKILYVRVFGRVYKNPFEIQMQN